MRRLLFLLLLIPFVAFGQKAVTYGGKVVTESGKVAQTDQPPYQGDLNFWTEGRDGLILPDHYGNDANITLPYYYKPTGNECGYVSDASKLDILTNDLTLCCWIKSESTNKSAYQNLIGKTIGGPGYGQYAIKQNITTGYLTWQVISTGTLLSVTTTVDFTTLDWAFLRLDINQSTHKARFFVNEIQIGSDQNFTGTFPVSGAKFAIGSTSVQATISKTSHSDTYIYNRLLSDPEALTLMNRGFVSGAAAHWTFSEKWKNGGSLFYDVSGNGNHLTLINDGATKRAYGIMGSRYALDKGYTLYYNSTAGYFYIPFSYAGTQLMGDVISYSYNFSKVKNYAGNLSNHNLADSYITFEGANWDRSDVTIFNNLARTGYYLVGTPKAWHPSELNQVLMDSWLNSGYCDINFIKGHENSVLSYDYLEELFSYNIVKTGDNFKKVLRYTNDYPYFFTELNLTSTQSAIVSQVALVMNIILNKKVYIDWGDGNIVLVTGTGSNATTTSTYAGAGTYNIKIYWDLKSITQFSVSNTTLSGDLTEFNKLIGLTNLSISGGDIAGDLGNLTCPLGYLSCAYDNNIYGDLADLPATLTSFVFYGESAGDPANLYGLVDDLPAGLHVFNLESIIDGNITGNTDNLPVGLTTLNLAGPHYAITGNLDNLPSTLIQFCVNGTLGTWTGSINSFTGASFYYLSNVNMPNIIGDIETLNANITYLSLNGENSGNISGDISHLPAGLTTCALTDMGALVVGNIEDLPATLGRISIINSTNIIYNGGSLPAWTLTVNGIIIDNSWNSTMVDAFLINAASRFPVNGVSAKIKMDYAGMGARTSASDAAVSTLTGNGYVVTTN